MDGYYHDPKHGHGLRRVRRRWATKGTFGWGVPCYNDDDASYEVIGVYGDDEAPHTHGKWTARMTVRRVDADGTLHLDVDFAGKPLKTTRWLTARYQNRRIHWSDGNVWHKLYVHPSQLR